MKWLGVLLMLLFVTMGDRAVSAEGQIMTMKIASPAFVDGGEIPRQYTCDGEDFSPALHWGACRWGRRVWR